MFDKMYFNASSPLDEKGLKAFKRHQCAMIPDRFYGKAYRLNLDAQRFILLKTSPRYGFGHISPSSIELNPMSWESWKTVLKAISAFVDPECLHLDRLDHVADLPIPISKVHEGLRVKSKQDSEKYWGEGSEASKAEGYKRGELTGLYYGKRPEVICVYDKAFQIESLRKLRKIPGAEVGVRTRFEVRHYNRKVLFPRLSDINRYLDINPFEKLEFYEFPASEEKKAEAIRSLSSELGLHELYIRLNRQNNFKRTHGKHLIQRDLARELHEVYRLKLGNFLGVDAKVAQEEGGEHGL